MIIEAKSPVETILTGSTGVWSSLLTPQTSKQASNRRELRELLEKPSPRLEQRIELYKSLSDFLVSGNDRFILYFPLELVPQTNLYKKVDPAIDRFIEIYSTTLLKMMSVRDVRADFIDGDIPDLALNEYPEIVVQSEYIADALRSKGYNFYHGTPKKLTFLEDQQLPWNLSLFNSADPDDINKLVRYALNDCQPNYKNLSAKREKWLRWDHRRRSIIRFSRNCHHLFTTINNNWFNGLSDDSLEAVVSSIGRAVEHGTEHQQFVPFLKHAQEKIDLTGIICRWYHSQIIDEQFVSDFGIIIPNIAGNLNNNLLPVKDQIEKFKLIIESKVIDDIIYPMFIVFGSRLKGYCSQSSDIDIAVLIKPGTRDQHLVTKRLNESFGTDVTQYWLDDHHGNLMIKDFKRLDAYIGESLDSHVILNGSWFGEEQAIEDVANRLILPYIQESDVKEFRVKQMERDILQYRLLHRGYSKLFPTTTSHTFFDEGYRLTASKLYTTHVFIP